METPPISSVQELNNSLFAEKSIEEKQKLIRGIFPFPKQDLLNTENRRRAVVNTENQNDTFKINLQKEGHRILQGQVLYPFQSKIDLEYSKVDPLFFNGSFGDPNINVESNLIGTPLGASTLEDPRLTYIKNMMKLRENLGQENLLYDNYLKELFMINTERGSNYYINQLELLEQGLSNWARNKRNEKELIPSSRITTKSVIGDTRRMKLPLTEYQKTKRQYARMETDFANIESNPRSSKFLRNNLNNEINILEENNVLADDNIEESDIRADPRELGGIFNEENVGRYNNNDIISFPITQFPSNQNNNIENRNEETIPNLENRYNATLPFVNNSNRSRFIGNPALIPQVPLNELEIAHTQNVEQIKEMDNQQLSFINYKKRPIVSFAESFITPTSKLSNDFTATTLTTNLVNTTFINDLEKKVKDSEEYDRIWGAGGKGTPQKPNYESKSVISREGDILDVIENAKRINEANRQKNEKDGAERIKKANEYYIEIKERTKKFRKEKYSSQYYKDNYSPDEIEYAIQTGHALERKFNSPKIVDHPQRQEGTTPTSRTRSGTQFRK